MKAPSVLVISETGEKLGEMDTEEAINLAQSKDLDLIEVASKVSPPVTKIMSWNKFKYELDKKKKDSRGKNIEQKEMWFKAFISDNDLQHKLKKVKEFILKKNPVKITIRAKGRVTRSLMSNLMKKILVEVEEYAESEGFVKSMGRNISVIIKPRKTKLVKEVEEKPTDSSKEVATPDPIKLKNTKNEKK